MRGLQLRPCGRDAASCLGYSDCFRWDNTPVTALGEGVPACLATGVFPACCNPALPLLFCCELLWRVLQVGACLPAVLALPASSCASLQASCMDNEWPSLTKLLLALGRETGCQAMSCGRLMLALHAPASCLRWSLLQAFETLLWRWALPAEALPSLLFPGKRD